VASRGHGIPIPPKKHAISSLRALCSYSLARSAEATWSFRSIDLFALIGLHSTKNVIEKSHRGEFVLNFGKTLTPTFNGQVAASDHNANRMTPLGSE
jgi:hypothetical protein